MDMTGHWDGWYREKGPLGVSWRQERPELSLRLIRESGVAASDPLLDVGGGGSTLADCLVQEGYSDLTVVDLSREALDFAAGRSKPGFTPIRWLVSDVACMKLGRRFRLWHDRAVFHFLIDPGDQERYVQTLLAHLVPGGTVILAVFAEDGPKKCSGLPVRRFDAARLAGCLGREIRLEATHCEMHQTPLGAEQSFIYGCFRHVGPGGG